MCPLVSSCFIYVPLRFLRMNHNKQESRNRKTKLTQATSICSMRSLYVLLSCLIFQLAFWDNLEDQEDLLWTLQTPILAKWKLPNCPWKHRQMPWVKTEAKRSQIRHDTTQNSRLLLPAWQFLLPMFCSSWMFLHSMLNRVSHATLGPCFLAGNTPSGFASLQEGSECSEMFWDVLRCSEMFWDVLRLKLSLWPSCQTAGSSLIDKNLAWRIPGVAECTLCSPKVQHGKIVCLTPYVEDFNRYPERWNAKRAKGCCVRHSA